MEFEANDELLTQHHREEHFLAADQALHHVLNEVIIRLHKREKKHKIKSDQSQGVRTISADSEAASIAAATSAPNTNSCEGEKTRRVDQEWYDTTTEESQSTQQFDMAARQPAGKAPHKRE